MKKHYFLLLFLIAFASFAKAQKIIPIPNDSMEITAAVTDTFQPNDIHIGLKNNTASSVTITWGMINHTIPLHWAIGLCDNNNCYDLLLNGGPYTASAIGAGDTLDMKFQYTASSTGTGNTYVYAYITGDSANSVVFLDYKANLTVVSGIADNYSANKLRIYPNPVQHSFVVSGLENAGNLSFEIYDMKGAVARSKMISAGNTQIEISVENLSAGEYVLKATDANGKLVGTSRLNKMN